MLIDVRTPEEYQQGHLAGSVNIPLPDIRSVRANKNAPIKVYCKSGKRSAQAKGILEAMGYTNVTNLGGLRHLR